MTQQRTRDRHALLVNAAADLLQAQGWSALTHRGLVAASGVPLASMTYYFDGVEDLVAQAAGELARRHVDRARATVQALPRRRTSAARAAGTVVELLVGPDPSPQDLLGYYERYLRASRSPRLRELVTGWNTDLLALVADALDRSGRPADRTRLRLLVAALDGLLVTALAEGAPDPVAVAVKAITPLVPAAR